MDQKERKRQIYRVTIIGAVVNVLLAVGKLVAGIFGRSSAMVADAIHSLSDLATDFVVLAFARISTKPEDEKHHYGHGKFETLSTIIISLALWAVGGSILWNGIGEIRGIMAGEEIPRPGLIAFIAAAVSIAGKELLYQYTALVGRRIDSPSVIANAWHHRSDAFSSIGTLLGIGLAYFMGEKWRIADPIAAILVSLFIFRIAYRMIYDGICELMERALPPEKEQRILQIIGASPEVSAPHRLRTRQIGSTIAIEVHIRVEGGMSVRRSHAVASDIERRLKEQFGDNALITIHVEPKLEEEATDPCAR